jgi:ribosomal protein S18 acetylase RimI-like enzyme
MEILDLRLISSDDLRPLLEAERAVWRETLRWDYSATGAMVLRFMDAHALTGYAMLDGPRVVGYSFYVIESGKALVGDAFVHPEYRHGTNEVKLMTHVLETLQAMPGLRRIEAQLLNLDGESIGEHFLSLGFNRYDRHFLFLSIPDAAEIHVVADPGVQVVPWETQWFRAASDLILESYRGHVDSAISDQYRTRAGAARFLENIIRLPGCGTFLPEASFLAVRRNGSARGQLCGMILTSVVSDRVAHITQLCVEPKRQGQGLGKRLIAQVAGVLRSQKFQGATLSVTVSNTRAAELYRSLGFEPLTSFPAFVWDAPAGARRVNLKPLAARL